MAIEIKRPLVSDLFAIGSSVGAYGNNAVAPAIVSGSYQPPQGVMNPQAQQQGGGSDAIASIAGKAAGKGLDYYMSGAGAGAGAASSGSGVGFGLGQSLVSGGIGSATYAGSAGAAGFGAGASGAAAGTGFGLGGSLVGGGMGAATYAGGAAGAGAAGAAGASAAGAGAGAGAAGAGAAGGAAAGGAASGAAAAGPFAAIAAAIMLNEQDSRSRGLRDSDPNEYYKDLFSGKVLEQDVEGKWAPMTDNIFGEKTGLGNDQRFAANLMTGDFKNAFKNLKKSSLATGFGLWG